MVKTDPCSSGKASSRWHFADIFNKCIEFIGVFSPLHVSFILRTFMIIYDLSTQKRGCQVRQGCPKDSQFQKTAQMGVQILVSPGQHLRTHLKENRRYDQGSEIHVSQGKFLFQSVKFSWLDA